MGTFINTNRTTTMLVNKDTGEVINHQEEVKVEENKSGREDEPEFVKLYLDDIMLLSDLPKGLNPILYWLLQNCMPYFEKADGKFAINSAMKREMARELNTTVNVINNALSRFTKTKILYRIDTGYFQFNPYLFGRGKWKDIKRIRMQIDYSEQGRILQAVVQRNTKQELEAEGA